MRRARRAGDPAVGARDPAQDVGVHGRPLRRGLVDELAPARRPHRWERVEVRLDRHAVEVVVPAVELHVRTGEQRHRRVQHFVGSATAFGLVHATRLELGAVPAGADPVDVAVAREVVQRGDLLRQHRRLPGRQDEDRRAELDPLGHRGDVRQRHQRVEPADPVEAMRGDDVVGDPQRVETQLLGAAGEPADVVGMVCARGRG